MAFALVQQLVNFDLLENSLRNYTFLTLFVTTVVYWINTAFYSRASEAEEVPFGSDQQAALLPFGTTKETLPNKYITPGQKVVQPVYPNPSPLFTQHASLSLGKEEIGTQLGSEAKTLLTGLVPAGKKILMVVSNLLLVFLLLVRWEISGHFPLSNLYESLMFLAWSCTFLYLILSSPGTNFSLSEGPNPFGPSSLREGKRPHALRPLPFGQGLGKGVDNILGSLTASSALLMNAFATFSLPKEMQYSAALVPALQSNWLMMHVTVMIISYATLIIGSLLSILFLLLNYFNSPSSSSLASRQPRSDWSANPQEGVVPQGDRQASLRTILDLSSYRIIGLGFPFLTIGILSGAVWANEAWGSYWSWDPKETWALLTWLVFAIYLHTRLTKGWEGSKPAIIASLGFVVVWFCYLGVNLLGEGLHSYGFF
jgi:cytochrome c-type biogenesis protein CcsB